MKIVVGDKVRVHLHPPGPMKSFSEGVVRRVDVSTPEGRFLVVEVTHEVILDQEHRIWPGFQDYVRYECRNDFPGRIEILSGTAQEAVREVAPVQTVVQPLEDAEREAEQKAQELHLVELEPQLEPEIVPGSGAEAEFEPVQVDVDPKPIRRPHGLMASLFGRKR